MMTPTQWEELVVRVARQFKIATRKERFTEQPTNDEIEQIGLIIRLIEKAGYKITPNTPPPQPNPYAKHDAPSRPEPTQYQFEVDEFGQITARTENGGMMTTQSIESLLLHSILMELRETRWANEQAAKEHEDERRCEMQRKADRLL